MAPTQFCKHVGFLKITIQFCTYQPRINFAYDTSKDRETLKIQTVITMCPSTHSHTKTFLLSLSHRIINPWSYSPKEPRPTEVVAARWQYKGPCGQQSAYPSTLISVFLTGFRYFSYQVTTQLSSRGWVDPVPDPILPGKFLGNLQAGIEPGTSWMIVRHANHYTKEVVNDPQHIPIPNSFFSRSSKLSQLYQYHGGLSQPNPLSSPPRWCPWDLFRSSKVCSDAKEREREWGAESNGKLPHQFIPSKTATLVPEFALGQNTPMMMIL